MKIRFSSLARRIIFIVTCFIVLLGIKCAAYAQYADSIPPQKEVRPFDKGSMRVTLILGKGKGYDQTYSIYGLGMAYYVRDNFEIGMDIEDWTGATPHIVRVSPEIRYILNEKSVIKPYMGLFYRHAFVSTYDDIDSAGARLGLYIILSQATYMGVGIAHESAFSCDGFCDDTYLELLLAFAF